MTPFQTVAENLAYSYLIHVICPIIMITNVEIIHFSLRAPTFVIHEPGSRQSWDEVEYRTPIIEQGDHVNSTVRPTKCWVRRVLYRPPGVPHPALGKADHWEQCQDVPAAPVTVWEICRYIPRGIWEQMVDRNFIHIFTLYIINIYLYIMYMEHLWRW